MCMKSWKISVNALSWTLYLLGSHWDELKNFQEEVSTVVDGKNDVEWKDLFMLMYSTMCIKGGR
eukprot:m.141934 g.141934  ORF g.141934 m.141934 type:complete len:64 (+) comp38351_c0_seq14:410-601(+)